MLLYYKKFFHILMMYITYSNSFLTPPEVVVQKNNIPKSELIFAINESQKTTHMEGCH